MGVPVSELGKCTCDMACLTPGAAVQPVSRLQTARQATGIHDGVHCLAGQAGAVGDVRRPSRCAGCALISALSRYSYVQTHRVEPVHLNRIADPLSVRAPVQAAAPRLSMWATPQSSATGSSH